MKKSGFTIIELMISLGMFIILSGSVIVVYITFLRSWDARQSRSGIRSEMTQAMDDMVRNLREATSIDALAQDAVSFTADLGEGPKSYRYYLYNAADTGPYPPYNAASYNLNRAFGASAWLSGWTYRKSHIINSESGAGTNYQVKIIVHYGSGTDSGADVYLNSHSNTDFSDVRFTDTTNSPLAYWIESQVTGDNAVIWVKVAGDLGTTAQTVYLYYGNSGAITTSSGANTFLFFDDFSGNLSQWTIDPQNTDSVSIVSGTLRHMPDSSQTKNSLFDSRAVTSSFTMTNGAVHYKVNLTAQPSRNKVHQMGWRVNGNTLSSGYGWQLQNRDADGGFCEFASGNWSQIGTAYAKVSSGVWYDVEVRAIGSSMQAFVNGTLVKTVTDATTAGPAYLMTHSTSAHSSSSYYLDVDDVRVRKIVATEPAHGAWSGESTGSASTLGQTVITHLLPPGTAVFSQSGKVITIDLTAVDNDERVHMRTKVRPRNL